MPTHKSLVSFQEAHGDTRVDALADARIEASSRGLGWQGVSAERGSHPRWDVRDLVIQGHYLALNLDARPLVLERPGLTSPTRTVLPPRSVWLQPSLEPFSHRVDGPCIYGAVVLDPETAARAAGVRRIAPAPAYGLQDRRLLALMEALLAELDAGAPLGRLYGESIAAALSLLLARSAGSQLPPEPKAPRKLSIQAIRRVRDHLAGHLRDGSSLAALAALADVSPSQLLRGFRRATGETPHEHLLRLRLDAARERLRTGDDAIAAIATELGFADQPHLTRLFRARYGITPAAFRRTAL